MINCRIDLFKALSEKAVVLTPNARLTKVLSETYDACQKKTVWPAPLIYPFNTWLELLWQSFAAMDLTPKLTLLNELQSNLIWLDLINEYGAELYNTEALSKKLKQALGHCLAWQIDTSAIEFTKNEETLFFQRSLEKYKQLSADKISQAELINKLLPLVQINLPSLPNKIILAYFDDFTPAQQTFLEVLANANVAIEHFDEQKQPKLIRRVETHTEEEELARVVEWIKVKQKDEGKNIGVVIPNLQQSRDYLEIFLLKHFKKEEFNISMGRSLDQFSLVNSAFSLLSLPFKSLSLEQVHLLCHSSFIGKSTSEALLKSNVYQKIKATTEKMFYVKGLNQHFKGLWLEKALGKLLTSLYAPVKQTLAGWCETFTLALEAIGFPGEQILSSYEYQIHLRLMQALNEYALLAAPNKEYLKSEALHLLDWQLKQIIFQPKAHNSKVHLIGFLESLGLQFDALWVMDLNEFQLPQKLNPSAFIPIEFQREKHMPHASEERELMLAQKHIKRLSHSADEVIFSHHLNKEGSEVQASFLIADYPLLVLAPLAVENADHYNNLEWRQGCLEVDISDPSMIKGGSYLVKEQAQCPFRAFSKFKLKLPEPRENMEGLDNLDKGVLIHHVMELFWREVGSQQKLLALEASNDLETLVRQIIELSLVSLQNKKPYTFNKLFTDLEKKRLFKIVMKYLELEKERPPFKVIHLEFESLFIIEALKIKLRVDRIDELENGDWLVIDYKTGSPSLSSLFEVRVTEPQLPIYVLTEKKIKAVLYAQLQQRTMKNKGLCENDIGIKGVKTIEKQQKISWQAQCEKWHEAIAILTNEFISGVIEPNPSSELLCVNCSYIGLCGVYKEA